jgi:hypothetical protein
VDSPPTNPTPWSLLVSLAAPTLGILGAIGRVLWKSIQTQRLERVEAQALVALRTGERIKELEAERNELRMLLKTEQTEHWRTAMALERLLGKCERERAGSSRPPPRST